MKASAVAHPIQGLIKYHGLRDRRLRLPYHDSISVCTAPLLTHTTVEFGHRVDSVRFGDRPASMEEMRRVLEVVDALGEEARGRSGMRMRTLNNFPSNIGLGASASGFAALAVAAAKALGLELSLEELSRFARRGAGSAARAVTGGFSRWYAGEGDADSISRRLPHPDGIDMAIVCALVPMVKTTDLIHPDVLSSPFFKARLEYLPSALEGMESAIRKGDVDEIGRLAEMDTLVLHGITMTGADETILWRPDTLRVILEVKSLRKDGVQCHFSIDTGATVYINCRRADVTSIRERMSALGIETLECSVGGPASITDVHLF
ncbi:MAG TPA: diphosphomevalonate decarboxylase [Euryarchaeota archaeon]|jgi:phosphomevalonate decarboxylase|nr:diphosphomevalonate decarboxylase [Euryarchaeota archaeon]